MGRDARWARGEMETWPYLLSFEKLARGGGLAEREGFVDVEGSERLIKLEKGGKEGSDGKKSGDEETSLEGMRARGLGIATVETSDELVGGRGTRNDGRFCHGVIGAFRMPLVRRGHGIWRNSRMARGRRCGGPGEARGVEQAVDGRSLTSR